MGMKESQEQMPALQARPVSAAELGELAPKIRSDLRYSPLNTEEDRGPYAHRKSALGAVRHDLLRPADHMTAFAAMHEGKVVGFLAVEKTPQGKKAAIRELWTSLPGRPQRAVVAALLNTAKRYLVDHGYPKLEAKPVSASDEFSVMKRTPELGRFLRVSDGETGEAVEDIEIAEEDETSLPAAEDGEGPFGEAGNDNFASDDAEGGADESGSGGLREAA